MRILVTGAGGFVGSHVADQLARNHEVLRPTTRDLDLLDTSAVEAYLSKSRPDAVVHSAVRGGPAVLHDTLRMQANLLRCRNLYSRLLYFGSGAEFDKSRDISRVTEDSIGDRIPNDAYGLAKYWCNMAARSAANVVNLRLFGVYGPGEGYLYKFISNAIVKALLGYPIRIRQNVRFSYLYVDDIAPIVDHVLQASHPQPDYNIVPRDTVTLVELAEIVRETVGKGSQIDVDEEGMNYEYTAVPARIDKESPGLVFTTPQEGVGRLVAFYRMGLSEVDRDAVVSDCYATIARTRLSARAEPFCT
jgi:nucleoside-diphosphate-sugar epimerase